MLKLFQQLLDQSEPTSFTKGSTRVLFVRFVTFDAPPQWGGFLIEVVRRIEIEQLVQNNPCWLLLLHSPETMHNHRLLQLSSCDLLHDMQGRLEA
jgi:hypothetical protein